MSTACHVADAGCEVPAGWRRWTGTVVINDEPAPFECFVCGQPVCDACSKPLSPDTGRACNDCLREAHRVMTPGAALRSGNGGT